MSEADTKVKTFTGKKSRKKAPQVIIEGAPEKPAEDEAKPQAFSQAFDEKKEK